MKIYFLRHENRYMITSFFTPLTEKGKQNSVKLINTLKTLDITTIYSSPLLRTLQTIEPFVKNLKKKINLENSIREINNINILTKKESIFDLPKEFFKKFNINSSYKSFLKSEEIIYPEEISNLKRRFNNFLKYLIKKYHKTNENILIVSHAGIIEGFIRKLEKKKEFNLLQKIKPYNYPLGKITQIVNKNKLVFQPINWILKKIDINYN
ncbi:putative phosphoglycerate mutase [Cafeteria roenbergensis virus]|uniref:Putative phosphoglycerate mutase n=1 Tax=Cafeteria roenbergensis virus (strain BV-PW1) TaxID=693272 RepID=E3T4P5_CROVB|nr:putative phosphoglycerate mutase [Cafeteria roenbergensis virus BV-PW1]ADO67158.1 putative phosphoglycerate mutase [Cafeteria roenbergensis virus BV-PW1]